VVSEPELKVVGEIKPPDYRDPVKMLRNLADDIENDKYGAVHSIAIATFGDAGLEVFGGGGDSVGPTIAMLFQAASMKMCQALVDFESVVGETSGE
jgi:hypothetical protein